jgi:beta-mannosidase
LIRFFAAFLFICFRLLPITIAQDLFTSDLGGDWLFRQAGTSDWKPARVPGVVHLDLMRNDDIPDPFMRDNEDKVQWISDAGWEYIKRFEADDDVLRWQHIDLVFEGLDTYSNVYLNDSLILVTDNMFREWVVGVKGLVKPGTNTLRIQFPAVNPEIKKLYDKLPVKLPGDEKVICRKAAYHFGWDWGPKLMTSGIWRPVYLRFRNSVGVSGVQFVQDTLTDSIAIISGNFTLQTDQEDSISVRLFLDSTEVLQQTQILKPGTSRITCKFPIRNPARWWPNGMGNASLYQVGYEIFSGNNLVDKGSQKIGLRTIELIQDKDSVGQAFYFKVNGIPVFIRGANYIPQDNFLPRVNDSAYIAIISEVKSANMNMLRVWGGGIYENDIFYDLCDENGIMVWQDFMFACAMYPGNKAFLANVQTEAIQNISRLRRHPCLALWCGNNEIDEGWKNWGWQKQYGYKASDSTEIYQNYQMIFQSILPEMVRKFDSLRPYIASSPLHGWGRSKSMTEGDSHYWGIWWGKEPFGVYEQKVGRFMSEYGFQGFPDYSTICEFTSPDDRTLGSHVMKVHQKHPVGYETIDEYLLRDYKKPKDFESYIYVSQLLQAKGIILAIEAHRRAAPRCMGTLYWQLNDCWPVVSWSSLDYYGKKKALQYRLTRAYDNILISPVAEDGHVKVYISSAEKVPVKGILSIKLTDFQGNAYSIASSPVEVQPNMSQIFFDTLQTSYLGKLNRQEIFCHVTLSCASGNGIYNGLLYFVSPKELALPVPSIQKTVSETPAGYNIHLSGDKLVKNLFLSTTVKGDFSDNYFDLLPGESVDIQFITTKKNPKMDELIVVKSLIDTY